MGQRDKFRKLKRKYDRLKDRSKKMLTRLQQVTHRMVALEEGTLTRRRSENGYSPDLWHDYSGDNPTDVDKATMVAIRLLGGVTKKANGYSIDPPDMPKRARSLIDVSVEISEAEAAAAKRRGAIVYVTIANRRH